MFQISFFNVHDLKFCLLKILLVSTRIDFLSPKKEVFTIAQNFLFRNCTRRSSSSLTWVFQRSFIVVSRFTCFRKDLCFNIVRWTFCITYRLWRWSFGRRWVILHSIMETGLFFSKRTILYKGREEVPFSTALGFLRVFLRIVDSNWSFDSKVSFHCPKWRKWRLVQNDTRRNSWNFFWDTIRVRRNGRVVSKSAKVKNILW